MKRYIYIILGIIIVAALAIGVILFFRKEPLSTAVSGLFGSLPNVGLQTVGNNTGNSTNGGTGFSYSSSSAPGAPNTALLSHSPTLTYFVSADDSVVTIHPDGTIEAIANGQSTNLSSSVVNNILSAAFSFDGEKILVSYGDSLNPQWTVFDVKTKTWSPLPVNPTVAAWSPSDYQIAYFASVNGVSALETVDLAVKNAKPKFVSAFPGEDFQLLWKSPSDIIMADRASALFSGSIFSINIKTGVISTVVINKVGLEAEWNSSGTMAVVLAGTQLARGGQLGIVDNSGTLLHRMTFLTLPSKCVFPSVKATPAATSTSATATTTVTTAITTAKNKFSSLGLICGLPRNGDDLNNNPLPDAYNEKVFLTSDDFYGIDLSNGKLTPLFTDQSQNFDASNVKLSNDAIYFINRRDQKLYSVTPSL